MLNTGRPCTGTAEHTDDELENRAAPSGRVNFPRARHRPAARRASSTPLCARLVGGQLSRDDLCARFEFHV